MSVAYPAPTVLGGTAPVTSKCSPAAESSFTLGSTAVTCTVTDALQRNDTCTFSVTVVAPPPPPPQLSATEFVCFGDSMTAGLNLALPRLIASPPGSYPADILTLLTNRYTTQNIKVLDEGIPGEAVGDGLRRLPGVLAADRPDAVLLLEGVNDVNGLGADGIDVAINGLRNMVRQIRTYGVPVFLATIPPQRPGAMRAYAPTLIAPTNDRIRTLAATEGAVLVDIYKDFNGDVTGLIGDDGLHPNAAGYERMAESFVAAIRSKFEIVPTRTIVSSSNLPALLTRGSTASSRPNQVRH